MLIHKDLEKTIQYLKVLSQHLFDAYQLFFILLIS